MARVHVLLLTLLPLESTPFTTGIFPFRIMSPAETPAQDRMISPDGIVSFPATIVPKIFDFGDKPFWVPHAYFNMCPFVRGPDIDPVWSVGCNPPPLLDPLDTVFRLQQMQQQQLMMQAQQQMQQQQDEDEEPSWFDQVRPAGPIDFGMSSMYGPVVQQEMYDNDIYRRNQQKRQQTSSNSWWGGTGSSFWG